MGVMGVKGKVGVEEEKGRREEREEQVMEGCLATR